MGNPVPQHCYCRLSFPSVAATRYFKKGLYFALKSVNSKLVAIQPATNYKRGIHLASTAGILSQLRNNTRRWRSNRLKLVKFGWVYYRSAIAERVRLRRWLLAFGLRDQVEIHSAIPRAVVKQSSISFFGNHVRLKNIEKGIELALKFVSKIHRSNSR